MHVTFDLTLCEYMHVCMQLKFNYMYVYMYSLLKKKNVLNSPNELCSLRLLLD